jgi:hypothetical protein
MRLAEKLDWKGLMVYSVWVHCKVHCPLFEVYLLRTPHMWKPCFINFDFSEYFISVSYMSLPPVLEATKCLILASVQRLLQTRYPTKVTTSFHFDIQDFKQVMLIIMHFYLKPFYGSGHALAQLRYKPEGRGFDSRWCHWIFLNLNCPSGRTMALSSTRNISWG